MPLPFRLRHLATSFAVIVLLAFARRAQASVHFQPVSPDELKMTSEPQAPGAPAVILYREVNRDDYGRTGHGGLMIAGDESASQSARYEEDYFRIKILTEEGRKYANIEIPLPNVVGTIGFVNGRTIRPDGTVVNFDGNTYDKTIIKTKGFQFNAKTFVLPDVQVGCIIEYFYTITFKEGYIYSSQWILSNELFTKRVKFTLRPYQNDYVPMNFRWSEHLPQGTPSPKQIADGTVQLEATDIAAFRTEDFMPPEGEFQARVDFVYSLDRFENDPAKFWKAVGKKRNDQVESFIGKRSAMDEAVSQIVSPSDSPEIKLRKIYARVQQMHNTSYEVQRTLQELKRGGKKTEDNVEDVWKRSGGSDSQLTWLFLALTRSAGIEAYAVLVSDRRNYFFNPQSMQSGKLDANIVLVKLDGKDLYLDPGSAFTPFGMLRWDDTGVPGLRLDKDGGSWVQTSTPESSASRIERKADLKLSTDGSLDGKLTVTFTGLEALRRRVDERNVDDAARKLFLENEVKQSIPAGCEVELTKQPEWSNSEPPLVAEFTLKIPGWLSITGRRALFPLGVFGGSEKHVFEYSDRVYPIYFEFPAQKTDDITIAIPAGWQVTSMPAPLKRDLHVVGYALSAENARDTLHVTRKLEINATLIEQKYYAPLRAFYQTVKAGDEQQIVLLPGTATSSN